MKALVIALIRVYQRVAPSRLRHACRYEPSCSNYMIRAVEKYGVMNGVVKGFVRLIHCRPPYGGVDCP
jgi:uncharacterized protein